MSRRHTGCDSAGQTPMRIGNDPVSGEERNHDLEHQVEAEMGEHRRNQAATPVEPAEDRPFRRCRCATTGALLIGAVLL